jgi:hypothetical protein
LKIIDEKCSAKYYLLWLAYNMTCLVFYTPRGLVLREAKQSGETECTKACRVKYNIDVLIVINFRI